MDAHVHHSATAQELTCEHPVSSEPEEAVLSSKDPQIVQRPDSAGSQDVRQLPDRRAVAEIEVNAEGQQRSGDMIRVSSIAASRKARVSLHRRPLETRLLVEVHRRRNDDGSELMFVAEDSR